MDKKDIFVFGMILEGDVFVDGYGTTKEDKEMLRKALFKAYGAKENSTEEELNKLQKELDENAQKYIEEYREKIKNYVNS